MINFAQIMKDISILIPTYNDRCAPLVETLQQQACTLDINYEIIVADDGSTDADVLAANRSVNQLPHCRLVECPENKGRSAIRNFLAQQARYPWLLFLDCGIAIHHQHFLHDYALSVGSDVIDGGVSILDDGSQSRANLRYIYELKAAPRHSARQRSLRPYRHFRSTNFMISRNIMLRHPFDERFHSYGYEDVLFGKALEHHQVSIQHIDNSVALQNFESNDRFISKTEESLRTLYQFREELQGYSRLLDHVRMLGPFAPLVRYMHRLLGPMERRHLTSSHPSLPLFHLYRLGYYLSLRS